MNESTRFRQSMGWGKMIEITKKIYKINLDELKAKFCLVGKIVTVTFNYDELELLVEMQPEIKES